MFSPDDFESFMTAAASALGDGWLWVLALLFLKKAQRFPIARKKKSWVRIFLLKRALKSQSVPAYKKTNPVLTFCGPGDEFPAPSINYELSGICTSMNGRIQEIDLQSKSTGATRRIIESDLELRGDFVMDALITNGVSACTRTLPHW